MEKFKVVMGGYLLLMKDNKVCLQKRSDDSQHMPGKWVFPAGHLDGNETAREGMVREAKEELGIDIAISDLYEPLTLHRLSSTLECINWFFVCDNWTGEITNMEADETALVEWFDLDKLPEDMIDYQIFALNSLMDGARYAEYGFEENQK